MTKTEVGGEFHFMDWPDASFLRWPSPHVWYSLGRHPLLGLLPTLMRAGRKPSLFVPDYFCEQVVQAWQGRITIHRYRDDPTRVAPAWDSIQPLKSGDLVMAVNYFGLRSGKEWRAWKSERQDVVIIEDHTHDPLSKWAKASVADFAFASLRKTMPLPDGAILWSPIGTELPHPPPPEALEGSALKLQAMVQKTLYLQGSDAGKPEAKRVFLRLQRAGEQALARAPVSTMSRWSRTYAELGCPTHWRDARSSNVSAFLARVAHLSSAAPLATSWPEGNCPLTAVLLFKTTKKRDAVRRTLMRADIYPTVLWSDARRSPEAARVSSRLLAFPLDQRYSTADALGVADAVLEADAATS